MERATAATDVKAAADPTAFLDGGDVAVTFMGADGAIRLARFGAQGWTCDRIEPEQNAPPPS